LNSSPPECLSPLIGRRAELVVLHDCTFATLPRTLDRADPDESLWGDEFLTPLCPEAVRIELRCPAQSGAE
jgi:hypothetical protein